MPYIVKSKRPKNDKVVKSMIDNDVKADGDLTYVLFKYCKYHVTPGYTNYKNFIGELEMCKLEIYRKLISNYENLKEKENGVIG